jgi:hypothetical protein
MPDAWTGRLSPDGAWRWNGTAWEAAGAKSAWTAPSWLPLGVSSPATWTALGLSAGVGVLVDQAFRAGNLAAAASAAMALASITLLVIGSRSWQGRLLVAIGAAFGACLTLRASPWLTIPDLAAAFLLLATAASIDGRGSVLDIGFAEAGARLLHGLFHMALGATFAARTLRRLGPRLGAAKPVLRGLAISLPIALVVGALLASADPIFASFFSLDLDPARLATDGALILAGGLAVCGLVRLELAESVPRLEGLRHRLTFAEGLVVVGVLDAVFAAFAVAQAVGLSGSGADAIRRAGMTYADYARSGFFQLLWAAGITLVVMVVLSRLTAIPRGRGALAWRLLTQLAIGLTLLIVYVASARLGLYEQAYGFTMLRLYSHIAAIWIGLVFLFLAVDLVGLGSGRRWFLGASAMTGLAILLALNAVNPEALVVQLDTHRATAANRLDAEYLGTLSSDSVPAVLASRGLLDSSQAATATRLVCRGPRTYDPYWAAFNLGDATAVASRESLC